MTPELVNLLSALPLHTILLLGVIVLWRENRRLTAKLEETRQTVASVHSLIVAQDARIFDQEAQKRAIGRKPHQLQPDEPYEAMPPYRKSDV